MTGRPLVLVVVKGYPRLSETFIAQEICSLERAGFALRIVSLRRPTDTTCHPIHQAIEAPVVYLPEYLREAPGNVLRALLALATRRKFYSALRIFLGDLRRDFSAGRARRFGQAAILASELPGNAGFLYAHFIHSPASVARYASLMTGLPWACSAHAKDIWTTPNRELADKLAGTVFTVTCTKAGAERLNSLTPPGKSVRLMYHGLDLPHGRRMTAPLSERNGQEAEKPVRLLTVARAVEKKGLDTLIEALAILPRDLAWNWTHIGSGALVKSLSALAEARGIGDRCRFLGARAQAEVIATYSESDIFVLPCRIARNGDRDGLPNVLMEAGSMGLALVSTPVSGVTELVEDGVTGTLVEPDAPDALARTLHRLVSSPLERYRLGREASRRVLQDFVHSDTIRDLIDLFPAELASARHESEKCGEAT